MKQVSTFLLVIAVISYSHAATFRNYIAHTISGTTYSVYVNSDTEFGETTLGEIRYTPSGGGGDAFTGIQDGVFDNSSVSGANWRVDITVPSGASNLVLQLATRNQDGDAYGFTGFNITMDNLLPVELIKFESRITNDNVSLNWQTTSELNNSHFEVQHSTNSKTWKTIDKVIGAGTTDEVKNYDYTHKNPAPSMNYYRLKQVDYDGAFEYSSIVSVNMGKDNTMDIFPNPVTDNMSINFGVTQPKGTPVSIYTISGKLVYQILLNDNTSSLDLDTNMLEPGMYFIQLETKQGQFSQRFIKK